MHRVVGLLALACCCAGAATHPRTPRTRRAPPELTLAENVYAKLSGVCRAVVDLRYSSLEDQKDVLRAMRIVQVDGTTTRTFPIDEAFASLTADSVFDITRQTKIIIHGYRDSASSEVPFDLARAYNEKGMFNVLMVDAEDALGKWYPLSVHNARLVGKRLANLLANLENYGASGEDFHLLGISLGAHIAGWAGKYFQKYKSLRIGRITGMDPAGPCFTHAYNDQRLDRQDASYVDVLHSNRLVQGVIEPLGHADYYLNGGGPNQPGCFTPSCSHLRAAQVYVESIRSPKSFVGVKCSSWKNFLESACEGVYSVVGYGSSLMSRGQYYLQTLPSSPYGLGMEGTVGETSLISNLNLI